MSKISLLVPSRARPCPRLLLLAGALLLGVSGMAHAQVAQMYWECRLPSAGVEAGWCPVSSGNVPPVSGTVTGNVGGYEFNASVLPTTTNASHAAGVALADLQTISIGSTNGLSGILTQVQYASKGGSTSGVVVYIWSKNPAATTCTNGSAIVTSQADNEFLVVPPILLTPALVLSAQDTTTYATASNLVGNFVNGSSNTNLYVCLVANATQTPGTTSDPRLNFQGIKDQP